MSANTQLATVSSTSASIMPLVAPFQLLDVYAETGTVEAVPRIDAIATISAGAKENNRPTRSRDGKIILHDPEGRAPGLHKALTATGFKSLLITFPFDDLSAVIQQRFTSYSAASLLAYGDDHEITVLGKDNGGAPTRTAYPAGTKEYLAKMKECKVSTSVYFHLAKWGNGNMPEVDFPDGLGFYRLRFTSRNSARSLVASIQMTAKYMGGRIAGVPFKLSLEQPEVAGPDGSRRKVPVWRCIFATPDGFTLSSNNFRNVASQALAQGEQLMLPAPVRETLELAAAEGADLDLDDEQIGEIVDGGRCDAEHYRKHWFALVKDSPLDSDEARKAYVLAVSEGECADGSLATLLSLLNEEEAQAFIVGVNEELDILYNDAVTSYDHLLAEGTELGINRRELPADANWKIIGTFTSSLQNAINRRRAAQTPTVEPEPEVVESEVVESEVVESEIVEEPKKRLTLSDAIRRKKELAGEITAETATEVAVIFEDADAFAPHISTFMAHLYKKGVQHGGDLAFEPMIRALNEWRQKKNSDLPPIETIAGFSESDTDAAGSVYGVEWSVSLL